MWVNKILAHSSNYTADRNKSIKYIVVHYTGNNGDSASGNCNYFRNANRNASAHYFVDELGLWQSVLDENTAWHCGTNGKYKHSDCRNNNSIGVELCSKKDSEGKYYFKDETLKNAVKLIKNLMKKYNVDINNVIRHYDVTGKICPEPMVKNEVLWKNFKAELTKMEDENLEVVKRNYKYENVIKQLDVVNIDGNNFVKVRDLAELLGKNVSYDSVSKTTILK